MRMGFRPLVNISAPLGANINSIFSSTTARSFVNPFLNQSSYPIDNHQQQQQNKDDSDDGDPDLKVELENKQLWDAFHSHGTEMVKSKFLIISFYSLLILCLGYYQKWTVNFERKYHLFHKKSFFFSVDEYSQLLKLKSLDLILKLNMSFLWIFKQLIHIDINFIIQNGWLLVMLILKCLDVSTFIQIHQQQVITKQE
jgi:hypothetical protein